MVMSLLNRQEFNAKLMFDVILTHMKSNGRVLP